MMTPDEIYDMEDYGFYSDIDSGIVLPNRFRHHIHISKKMFEPIHQPIVKDMDQEQTTMEFINKSNVQRLCLVLVSLVFLKILFLFASLLK
jgi:hypothetical protein